MKMSAPLDLVYISIVSDHSGSLEDDENRSPSLTSLNAMRRKEYLCEYSNFTFDNKSNRYSNVDP